MRSGRSQGKVAARTGTVVVRRMGFPPRAEKLWQGGGCGAGGGGRAVLAAPDRRSGVRAVGALVGRRGRGAAGGGAERPRARCLGGAGGAVRRHHHGLRVRGRGARRCARRADRRATSPRGRRRAGCRRLRPRARRALAVGARRRGVPHGAHRRDLPAGPAELPDRRRPGGRAGPGDVDPRRRHPHRPVRRAAHRGAGRRPVGAPGGLRGRRRRRVCSRRPWPCSPPTSGRTTSASQPVTSASR